MIAANPYPTLQIRRYLPKDFKVTTWKSLEPIYEELLNRPINNARELERWILDRNELDAAIKEVFGWRYIRLTINTKDVDAAKEYESLIKEIIPKTSPYSHKLNIKLVQSPYLVQLDEYLYFIYLRENNNSVEIFRKENINLFAETSVRAKEYGRLFAEMMVEIDGERMTLQQANTILESPDRSKREEAYRKSQLRMAQDADALNDIFDELVDKRHQIASNAGFENYRDFKFRALGRFDYTAQDCLDFHESIAQEITPIVQNMYGKRKKELGIECLRPWDLNVDPSGRAPLRPFENADELIQKSIKTLSALDPFFGQCVNIMRRMGHLDLETRKGKRPGGYNMPLMVTGVPFIFMNAANSIGDMRTFMHESGHAVHSFLTKEHKLVCTKRPPSEIAELAAMTMELLTMDYWDRFFPDAADLRRSKIWLLESVLRLLPWIATIDQFQHWLYTNPGHSRAERSEAWTRILGHQMPSIVDEEGIEHFVANAWHRQLHLFEVPFYYIEYGMAQLGALAIWKRYREIGRPAVEDYIKALKLGYSRPISEVYQAAGIEFNFSREYVRGLAAFVKEELQKLYES